MFLHIDGNQSRSIVDNLSDTDQPGESLSHLDRDGKSSNNTVVTSIALDHFVEHKVIKELDCTVHHNPTAIVFCRPK